MSVVIHLIIIVVAILFWYIITCHQSEKHEAAINRQVTKAGGVIIDISRNGWVHRGMLSFDVTIANQLGQKFHTNCNAHGPNSTLYWTHTPAELLQSE